MVFHILFFGIRWQVETYNSAGYAVRQEEKKTDCFIRLPDSCHNSHSGTFWEQRRPLGRLTPSSTLKQLISLAGRVELSGKS